MILKSKKLGPPRELLVQIAVGMWKGKIDIELDKILGGLEFEDLVQCIVAICLLEEMENEVFGKLFEYIDMERVLCQFD